MEFADRLKKLPPYLFAKIDQIKQQEIAKGRQLISLSIGDPDLPTPDFVVKRLQEAAQHPENHQYPSYWGMKQFREGASRWMEKRFGVQVRPDTQTLALIGSKEGLAHFPLAFINPGDAALCPNPGYPVYASSVMFAGGTPVSYDLKEENQYLPDFKQLEQLCTQYPKVKMIFLNYPNNPTSATATLDFFKEMVRFAKKKNLIVCHDNAYSEIYLDGKKPPSFLEAPGAMEVGCEFHSLSKTFNMTGWRVGFAVGHETLINGLAQVKTNIDSGVFNACQEAALAAFENAEPFCTELRSTYQKRRDLLVPALQKLGLGVFAPQATFYVWCSLPKTRSMRSESFVLELIQKNGIVSTPGSGFGTLGEGYVRFTLCQSLPTLQKAIQILNGPAS